jgi:hypothetical protein
MIYSPKTIGRYFSRGCRPRYWKMGGSPMPPFRRYLRGCGNFRRGIELIDLFDIDSDLVAAASSFSDPIRQASNEHLAQAIESMPAAQQAGFLKRIVLGESPLLSRNCVDSSAAAHDLPKYPLLHLGLCQPQLVSSLRKRGGSRRTASGRRGHGRQRWNFSDLKR